MVVWGTGFVGKMVIPEILRHPRFELVGVGVSNPDKVGLDVGEICGIGPIGLRATDDTEALIALQPDALVHYGPTAARADDNIRDIGAFLRAGIDVCSTAMTPWVWPAMKLNPPSWVDPITEACEAGGSSCFTTGIDPGFANDLLPLTLVGLCSEVRQVRALEILDYINYTGDYEDEMGIGRPPDFTPLLEHTDILAMSWGGTIPMMAHAIGVELDGITSTWEKWVTDRPITTAKGVLAARHRGRHPVHPERPGRRRAPHLPRAREPGGHRCGTGLATRAPGRRLPGGDRRHARRSPRRRPSASPTDRAGMPRRPAAWRRGSGPSTPCPTSTSCPRGG